MFGFVRKREVEELRARIEALAEVISDNQIKVDEQIRDTARRCNNYTQDVYLESHDKFLMILKHFGLDVIPERKAATIIPARLVPGKPPKKANKRTTKKANGGDEESG